MIASLCEDPTRDCSRTSLIVSCLFNALGVVAIVLRIANHLIFGLSLFVMDDVFTIIVSGPPPSTPRVFPLLRLDTAHLDPSNMLSNY